MRSRTWHWTVWSRLWSTCPTFWPADVARVRIRLFLMSCLRLRQLATHPAIRSSCRTRKVETTALYSLGLCSILATDSNLNYGSRPESEPYSRRRGCRLESGDDFHLAPHSANKDSREHRSTSHIADAVSYIADYLHCKTCHLRTIVDQESPEIKYCKCERPDITPPPQPPASTADVDNSPSMAGWEPYLEKASSIVWRKLNSKTGLYSFKMYAKFDDISADEFIAVQMDVSVSRKRWDTSTVELTVFDDADSCQNDNCLTSYRYYWRVKWPKFFADRDYVCLRKVLHSTPDHLNPHGTRVITSESVDDDRYPLKSDTVRVKDYSSTMVIRPCHMNDPADGSWSKPGVEFCMTAAEDPGVNLPTSITTWVAMRGMPDYIARLRQHCLDRRRQ